LGKTGKPEGESLGGRGQPKAPEKGKENFERGTFGNAGRQGEGGGARTRGEKKRITVGERGRFVNAFKKGPGVLPRTQHFGKKKKTLPGHLANRSKELREKETRKSVFDRKKKWCVGGKTPLQGGFS